MADPALLTVTREAEQADLRLLYQASVQDLAFFKQQQFTTSYYSALLLAGIAAMPQLIGQAL